LVENERAVPNPVRALAIRIAPGVHHVHAQCIGSLIPKDIEKGIIALKSPVTFGLCQVRPVFEAINGNTRRHGEHNVVSVDPTGELEGLAAGAGDVFMADGSSASIESSVRLNSDYLAGGRVTDVQPRR